MARNSDFASYCNDLLNDPNDLMDFDRLSRDSPLEPLVYYDLQPVSEPVKELVVDIYTYMSYNDFTVPRKMIICTFMIWKKKIW